MRIAILGIRGLPSTYSGYDTFADALGARLVARGHDVLVYCRSALFPQQMPAYHGMRLIYLPSLETKELSTLSHTWLCMADVVRRQTDIILVCNVANGLHLLIPRLLRRRTAINVDGLEWKRPKWNRLGRAYFRFAAHVACRLADRIVCDAEAMSVIYRQEFHARPVTIAYGADIAVSVNPDIVRAYGLTPGRYILVLGRLIPDNNADLLVRAFASVRTDMNLAIVGDANHKSPYVEHVHRIADSRVRFLGHVGDGGHVHELYCNAYAYIHGHEYGGTNPSLLTALGCGACVLALDTPFSREVLAGTYGLFFRKDAEDARAQLQRVIDDRDLRDHFATRARGRIHEAYTWEKITDQYERLFASMVDSTP